MLKDNVDWEEDEKGKTNKDGRLGGSRRMKANKGKTNHGSRFQFRLMPY